MAGGSPYQPERAIATEGPALRQWITREYDKISIAFASLWARRVRTGHGTPENTLAAAPGTLYVDLSGGASTTLYVKESGTGDTGWIAK